MQFFLKTSDGFFKVKIKQKHNVGSGYPSDPITVKFVRQYFLQNGKMPSFVRKSWKPVQKILNEN